LYYIIIKQNVIAGISGISLIDFLFNLQYAPVVVNQTAVIIISHIKKFMIVKKTLFSSVIAPTAFASTAIYAILKSPPPALYRLVYANELKNTQK